MSRNRWLSCISRDSTTIRYKAQSLVITPLISGTQEIPSFNHDKVISAIRTDQQGLTTFPEFLQAIWNAGVISYDVDFIARTVTYYGINGENYIEDYPGIDVKI